MNTTVLFKYHTCGIHGAINADYLRYTKGHTKVATKAPTKAHSSLIGAYLGYPSLNLGHPRGYTIGQPQAERPMV
jgi:hypothetical protein